MAFASSRWVKSWRATSASLPRFSMALSVSFSVFGQSAAVSVSRGNRLGCALMRQCAGVNRPDLRLEEGKIAAQFERVRQNRETGNGEDVADGATSCRRGFANTRSGGFERA